MYPNDVIQKLQLSRFDQILLAFSIPKTPRQVEIELGIKKLKLKSFIEGHFIKPLNPEARKGRLYTLTIKGKKFVNLPSRSHKNNWDIIGWVLASPRQRLVVLRILDSTRRTSENIRQRTLRYNSHLTRISTKQILKEFVNKGLMDTEMIGNKRYYLLTEQGEKIANAIINLGESEKYLNST